MAKKNQVVVSDTDAARQLTDQFKVVEQAKNAMLRECVKFGAMLIEWEAYIGGSVGGRGHVGEGLKGWMSKHCPEVNYDTAKGYKALAEKTVKMLGGGAVAVAVLQDKATTTNPNGEVIDIDAEIIDRRDTIFDEAKSRRQLEQMYFTFSTDAARGKAGRPAGTGHPIQIERDVVKAAALLWSKPMMILSRSRAAFVSAAKLLPLDRAKEAREELSAMVSALDARIAKG